MKQLNLIASTIRTILSENNINMELKSNCIELCIFDGKFKIDAKSFSFDDGEYFNELEIRNIYDLYSYIALKEMLFNGFKKHENSLIPFSKLTIRDKLLLTRIVKRRDETYSEEEIYRDIVFFKGTSRAISQLLGLPWTLVRNIRKYNRHSLIRDAMKSSLLSVA
jgi:hypothetical protein